MVKEIKTLAEFQAEIAGTDKLIIIDFTATWCPPCQMIKPIFHKMADDMPDCVFLQIDVDVNDETAAKCGINCMPTFQYYKNGEMIDKLEGASEDQLKSKIAKHK